MLFLGVYWIDCSININTMNLVQKQWHNLNLKRNLCREFTVSYYKELVEFWKEKYGFISFLDPPEAKGILLRHDVDRDLDKAVRMAEIEAGRDNNLNRAMFEHGDRNIVRSTYFILNTAKYWDSRDMIDAVRYIETLGHEIGWHNNAIGQWMRWEEPEEIYSFINDPIEYLRSEGVTINGTAAHGDRLCYKNRFINYNVFGFKSPGYDGYHGTVHKLSEFNLKYEAYHVFYNDYLADNYTGWNGDFMKTCSWGDGRYQVLIHPHCWRI